MEPGPKRTDRADDSSGPAISPTAEESSDSGGDDIMIYADPVYVGEASDDLNSVVDKLSDYVNEFPDVFAGGHYTTDYSQFSVSVAKPDDPAFRGLKELAVTLDPKGRMIVYETVDRSLQDLQEMQMSIVNEFMLDDTEEGRRGYVRKGPSLQGVGYQDSPARVLVYILDDPDDLPLESNPEVRAINAKYPGAVMFMKSPAATAVSDDGEVALG